MIPKGHKLFNNHIDSKRYLANMVFRYLIHLIAFVVLIRSGECHRRGYRNSQKELDVEDQLSTKHLTHRALLEGNEVPLNHLRGLKKSKSKCHHDKVIVYT